MRPIHKRCTPAKENKLAKIVLDCITYCLVAVEKCVRFLNKHAYIQTVLHGRLLPRPASAPLRSSWRTAGA